MKARNCFVKMQFKMFSCCFMCKEKEEKAQSCSLPTFKTFLVLALLSPSFLWAAFQLLIF